MNTQAATFAPQTTATSSTGRVLALIGSGQALCAGLVATLWFTLPTLSLASAPLERLSQVFGLALAPGLFLLVACSAAMAKPSSPRALNPLDGSADGRAEEVNRRVLTNSTEQLAIFLPALFALGFALQSSMAPVLPALVCAWVIGRILFWAGYQLDIPAVRIPGMSCTFACSVAAYGLAAWSLLG